MPRTTVNIDGSVLAELKRLQAREGKTLGELISELLAQALREGAPPPAPFDWKAAPMGAKVDLEDKSALHELLDLT